MTALRRFFRDPKANGGDGLESGSGVAPWIRLHQAPRSVDEFRSMPGCSCRLRSPALFAQTVLDYLG